jgi:hypothetical protein
MTEQTISRLRIALDEMVQAFDEHVMLPEKNCSCHSAPPCADCVENDFARNALANARDALRLADAPPPDDTIRLGDVHYAKDFLS